MSDFFGDVSYEVWRRGGNPDRLNRDRVDSHQRNGMDSDEAAGCEMRRWQAQRAAAEQEQEEMERQHAEQHQAEQDSIWEEECLLTREYGPNSNGADPDDLPF